MEWNDGRSNQLLALAVVIGGVTAGVRPKWGGGESINPAEGAFIPPLSPAGVLDDGVVTIGLNGCAFKGSLLIKHVLTY